MDLFKRIVDLVDLFYPDIHTLIRYTMDQSVLPYSSIYFKEDDVYPVIIANVIHESFNCLLMDISKYRRIHDVVFGSKERQDSIPQNKRDYTVDSKLALTSKRYERESKKAAREAIGNAIHFKMPIRDSNIQLSIAPLDVHYYDILGKQKYRFVKEFLLNRIPISKLQLLKSNNPECNNSIIKTLNNEFLTDETSNRFESFYNCLHFASDSHLSLLLTFIPSLKTWKSKSNKHTSAMVDERLACLLNSCEFPSFPNEIIQALDINSNNLRDYIDYQKNKLVSSNILSFIPNTLVELWCDSPQEAMKQIRVENFICKATIFYVTNHFVTWLQEVYPTDNRYNEYQELVSQSNLSEYFSGQIHKHDEFFLQNCDINTDFTFQHLKSVYTHGKYKQI